MFSLSKIQNAFWNTVTNNPPLKNGEYSDTPPLKFRYTRPSFLQWTTDDEVQVSADHGLRPIIVPRDITKLPWNSGYAEVINAGKSVRNEDQATSIRGVLYTTNPMSVKQDVPLDTTNEIVPVKNSTDSLQVNDSSNSTKDSLEIEADQSFSHETEELFDNEVIKVDNLITEAEEANITSNNDASEEPKFATPLSTPEPQRKVTLDYSIPWIYFALFDGHAGSGVAVAASNSLHKIIQEKLQDVADLLTLSQRQIQFIITAGQPQRQIPQPAGFQSFCSDREVTPDSLIVGALEKSFHEMDRQIAIDKKHYTMTGGCTALAAVFMFGKLYVANAGDSRAVICRGSKVFPMSNDFTPETERNRIRKLGQLRPELLGSEFTHLEFARRPAFKDIGERILYRDAYMSGWCFKSITREDLRFPLIYGEGKRSRCLATIGVTRGFGDHDLKALNTDIDIKPFLSSEPEVKIFNLLDEDLNDADVLVMGTDGLWDVTTNEKAAEIVQNALEHFPANDAKKNKYRYITAAQELVMHSRGKLRERNWRTTDNKMATIDDISVFVIPLRPYKEEYFQWEKSRNEYAEYKKSQPKGVQTL